MNVLLLLGTAIGIAGMLLAAIVSAISGARLRALVLGGAAAAWGTLYLALLLVVSISSRERLLLPGETKRFCGFYFDCHIGVAVAGDSVTPAIGSRRASGVYHVLSLRFSSDARRATLRPYDVQLTMLDADGQRWHRDRDAELALGQLPGLTRNIAPGGAFTATVVFDLPREVVAPRLLAGEGLGVDRLIEAVLIGDEDSFLHRKTLLELPDARALRAGRRAEVSSR